MFANCNVILCQEMAKINDTYKFDKLSIMRNIEANPCEEIYEFIWDNKKVHSYNIHTSIPNNHSIDLRDFSMPVSKSKIIVTSHFGYRKKFRRHHKGIDLDINRGDSIYSVFSGKIRMVGYEKNGYGKYIVVRHYNGLETIYAHLSKIFVKENQYINAGEVIAIGGNTGRSTGTHLHLEMRFCGIPINPIKIFNFQYKDITNDVYIFKK